MGLDIWLFGGFGIFLVLLFLVIYFKDLESNRKFERFERAIEDLNHQNHQLRQSLAHKNETDRVWLDDVKLEFHKKVQDEINTKVLPLLDSLKDIEDVISSFRSDQQERIVKLEQRAKSMNIISPTSSTSNEKEVIQAYNSGKKVHEIAKDLRIGLGEVEFILKMHNLL